MLWQHRTSFVHTAPLRLTRSTSTAHAQPVKSSFSSMPSSDKASQCPNPKETQILTHLCSQTLWAFLMHQNSSFTFLPLSVSLLCIPPDQDCTLFSFLPRLIKQDWRIVGSGFTVAGQTQEDERWGALPSRVCGQCPGDHWDPRKAQIGTCSSVRNSLIWADGGAWPHLGQDGSSWASAGAGSQRGRNLRLRESYEGLEADWSQQCQQSSGLRGRGCRGRPGRERQPHTVCPQHPMEPTPTRPILLLSHALPALEPLSW